MARLRHTPTLLVLLTLTLVASPGVVSAQAAPPASASPSLEKAALRLRYGLSLRQGEQVDLGPGLTYSGLTANDIAAWAAFYGLAPGLEWLGGQASLQREAFSLYREEDRVSEGSLLRLSLGVVARKQLGPVRGELSAGYGFAQLPLFTSSDTPSPAFQRGGRHAALVGARVRFPIVQRAQGEVRGELPLALSSSAAGVGGSSSGLSVGASVLVPVKRMGPWEGALVLDYQLVKDRLTADSGTRSEQTLQRLGAALEVSWFGPEQSGATPPPPAQARPGSLSIQVLDAETKGPLAGAQVTLITEARAQPPRAADAKGKVVVEELTPGEVLVRVAAQGYEPAEQSATVKEGERTTLELGTRKQPPPVGRLKVVVVDKLTSAPVAEAKVEVGDREVETDAAGQARLGELPPGPVLVKISASGFQSVEEAAVIVGGQEAEMPVPLVTAKRLGYATISGTIRSTRQGKPVVATLVIPAAKVRTRTDAQGSFSVKLKPGTYRIIISAKGHLTQTKSITVRDGEQAIYNVDLFPEGPVSALRATCASLLLLLAAGCDEEAPKPPPPGPITSPDAPAPASEDGGVSSLASLAAPRGEVRLERGGNMQPAAEGPLFKGDAVETGPDSAATIRFADGRTLEVGANARFVLDQDAAGVVVQVARGILLSRVPAAAKGKTGPAVELRILTPYGLTRVGGEEPSEVSVSVGPDASRVEVRMGAIAFVSKDGKELQASAGESVSVSAGRAELVPKEARVIELAPIQVTVRADSGRVEVRSKGSTRWRVVDKGGTSLSPGDGVRVRGGTASLALAGSASTMALAPGGELVVEGAGKQGSTDETRVDLRKGEVALKLASDRESRVVMPGLTVESGGAAHLNVRRTADGFDVAARAGDVTLVRGGSRQPLRAGEQALIATEGEGQAKVQALERSPVLLPMADDVVVYHRGLREVGLAWEGEGDAVVEVASDEAFTRPLLRGVVHEPYANVPVPARGTLYWRVRRPDGTEVSRGSATFAPERAPKDMARVTNEVPEGPEKTTIFYQDKPPAVTFTYSPEPQAAQYRISVYRSGELAKPVAERTVAETRAALPAGALGEGSFLWSVTPLGRSGKELRGGRMNKLDLVYDNSVPVLVVNTPKNGQKAGKRVRAVGVAPVGAKVTINGKQASLDGKHRFDTWAEPVGSPPLLLFKMQRAGAPEVFLVRTLKRGPEE